MYQVATDYNNGIEVIFTGTKTAAEAMLIRATRLFPNEQVFIINLNSK